MADFSQVQISEAQFEELMVKVAAQLVTRAEIDMKKRINAAGYVVTGSLRDGISRTSNALFQDLYAEFTIGFQGYGRFKDIKRLNTGDKLAPIDTLTEYVQRVGLGQFDYIPGYFTDVKSRKFTSTARRMPTDEQLARRIAWGIASSRKLRGQVRRKSQGIYSKVKGHLLLELGEKMMESLPMAVLESLKANLEES